VKLYHRYHYQIDNLIDDPGETGVLKFARMAALIGIAHLVAEKDYAVSKEPGILRSFVHTIENAANRAPATPARSYHSETELIYYSVVYGKLECESDNSPESLIKFRDDRLYHLQNVFRNPRIIDEAGSRYTTDAIERDRSRGIDFGFCQGTAKEAHERGFNAILLNTEQHNLIRHRK
jgi:hypothetical protein